MRTRALRFRFDEDTGQIGTEEVRSGPAGLASLVLPGGIALSADPGDAGFVALTVDTTGGGIEDAGLVVLESLLGAANADAVAALVGSSESLEAEIPDDLVAAVEDAARLAVVRDELTWDEALLGRDNPWWLAEAGVLAARLPAPLALEDRAAAWNREALARLVATGRRPTTGRGMRLLIAVVASARTRGIELPDGLDDVLGDGRPAKAAAEHTDEPDPLLSAIDELSDAGVVTRSDGEAGSNTEFLIDRLTLPASLVPTSRASMTQGPSPGTVDVRLEAAAAQSNGLWARAYAARDRVLHALGEFDTVGNDAIARLVLPRRREWDDLRFDVVQDPSAFPPSRARRAAAIASRTGALAASAERRGDPRRAAALWTMTSERWSECGDRDRSTIARGWAAEAAETSGGSIEVPQPTFEAIGYLDWGWQRLARARELPAAFVGDLEPSTP